uniref:Uncharacterized protein n=1 Tax=Aplanochytrium stocchinoi TaxID=215587 RepID=A0A7S3V1A2_9STRA|mmetsp:Transcript_18681/g.23772  ORF Transcript_18681/g.23772 Transcript_18681/m.23772 type:complete len:390 (+) Transcript_18681:296-1465(+)|eukprot:CAMPEP_0204869990 /NCGR_PEP_ID=MMETSP1348-20121228/31196_1 /ASSEMBLY_ACC=CAM_ASM_000700 /TAXON_ID=215587 /ORGANISM="Aplanochytrium stocchinoi, Strain GSBS06" /LENGTH=389 /DNA_ID=CAMNT_0052023569 /DNA_START=288 /DNA_END=1457 /DNA_ORIENTATION=-
MLSWLLLLLLVGVPWPSYSEPSFETVIASCTLPAFQNERPICGANDVQCCPGFRCQGGTCISKEKGSASEFALMAHAVAMSADAAMDDIASKISFAATSIIKVETRASDKIGPGSFGFDSATKSKVKDLDRRAKLYAEEIEAEIRNVLEDLKQTEKEYKDSTVEAEKKIQQLIKEKEIKFRKSAKEHESKLLLSESTSTLHNKSVNDFVRTFETFLEAKEQSFTFALARKLDNLETFVSRESSKIKDMGSFAIAKLQTCSSNMDEKLCTGNAANSLVRSTADAAENVAIRLLSAASYLRKSADSLMLMKGDNITHDFNDMKITESNSKMHSDKVEKGRKVLKDMKGDPNDPERDYGFVAMTLLSILFAAFVFRILLTHCYSVRTGYERI